MRALSCPTCRCLVTFERTVCIHCETPLGFEWERREFVALPPGRACANRAAIACHGVAVGGGLCRSCALTRTRPNDDDPAGVAQWAAAEAAKRRLLYGLLEVGLPTDGLRFDLLSGTNASVVTGHADGVITLDLTEADSAHRERTRTQLDEPYRTVLGHLRHEVGHYYHDLLAPEGSPARTRCRDLLGDDRADYAAAMDRHYRDGPPADWMQRHISAYASMHPAEDWAETFAHVLHIRDGLQTASALGITVTGAVPPATADDFAAMLDAWLPLAAALNAMSRGLGGPDVYPFGIGPEVGQKLGFIDALLRGETVAPELQ